MAKTLKFDHSCYICSKINLLTMKKLIALTMVCGFAFAFAACGGAATTESTETVDTVAAPMDTVAVDSTDSMSMDSTGAM